MRRVRGYLIEIVFSSSNSKIEGTGSKEAVKLKSSLVVLSRVSPGFATVEYPDFHSFLCISDIRPLSREDLSRG
jgi:hypothetical protein